MLSIEAEKAIEEMKSRKAKRRTATLEEMRLLQKSMVPDLPEDVEKEVFMVGEVEVEKLSLPSSRADSALVYIHGGAFRNCYAHNGYNPCVALMRLTGMTVYAMNYRLAPEHTYPTATMDCLKVWKHLLWKGGVDPKKSVFLGCSAGGTLALSVSLWSRDHGIPLPSSLIVNSPFVGQGIVPSEEEIASDVLLDYVPGDRMDYYFSSADDDDPCAYPILGDYFLFPPVAVYYAKKEILAQHSRLLIEKLGKEGVEVESVEDPELWHAFLDAAVPENRKHLERLAAFIGKHSA